MDIQSQTTQYPDSTELGSRPGTKIRMALYWPSGQQLKYSMTTEIKTIILWGVFLLFFFFLFFFNSCQQLTISGKTVLILWERIVNVP